MSEPPPSQDPFENADFKVDKEESAEKKKAKVELAFKYLSSIAEPAKIVSTQKALEAFNFIHFFSMCNSSNEAAAIGTNNNISKVFIDLLDFCYGRFVETITALKTEPAETEESKKLLVRRQWYLNFLSMLFNLMRNYSNYSIKFCVQVHENKGIAVLFKCVNSDLLIDFCIENSGDQTSMPFLTSCSVLRGSVGSLLNLGRAFANYEQDWKDCQAVESLLKYSERMKDFGDNKLASYIAIANVACDQEIEKLAELEQVLPDLISIIHSGALLIKEKQDKLERMTLVLDNENEDRKVEVCSLAVQNTVWHILELLNALYRMAVNDKIKFQIYDKFNMKEDLNIIIFHGNSVEKECALKLLWQLCFDSRVGEDVLKNKTLFSYLKSLAVEKVKSEPSKVSSNSKGILWLFKKKACYKHSKFLESFQKIRQSFVGESSTESSSKKPASLTMPSFNEDVAESRHIMISYNRESRDLCLRIKSELESRGFKVWIDVENISGSSLESMAAAIEKSLCVLICVTEKYKLSPYCRAEGEYAFQINKPFIPLVMQENYKPDGWLGILIGAKIFVNFTKYEFSECMRRLYLELKPLLESWEAEALLPSSLAPPSQPPPEPQSSAPSKPKPPLTKTPSFPMTKRLPQLYRTESVFLNPRISELDEKEVAKWFQEAQISPHISSMLLPCDGKLLNELYLIKMEAPEYFYSSIAASASSTDGGLCIRDVAHFTSNLRNLFESFA